MSANLTLVTIMIALLAVAVIARAVAGPLPDLADTGAGRYAQAKVGPAPPLVAPPVLMAAGHD